MALGETLKLEDGSTYSGEVRNNKPHGNATLTDSYGRIEQVFKLRYSKKAPRDNRGQVKFHS